MDRSARRWTVPERGMREIRRGDAVQPHTPVRRALRLVAALVLAWAAAQPAQAQSQHAPDLQFTSPNEFRVHPEARLWASDTRRHGTIRAGEKVEYFDALTGRQSADGSLEFGVEGQSGGDVTYCRGSDCGAVSVDVLAESGDLYIGVDIADPDTSQSRKMRSNLEDFPQQRVEVSVRSGQQKVYQEVIVDRPENAPDCTDYPEMSEDRYRCYYTREYLSEAFKVPDSALVDALPDQLMQDKDNYELVFAEEFTGSYTPASEWADNCDRGLEALDGSKWNYRHKRCRSDPEGAPCEYLEDGHLHISQTSQCGGGISSLGSFEPRYGYVEITYTIGLPAVGSGHRNYNVVMGSPRAVEAYALSTHNLSLDSLERLLTLVPWTEIDLLEHVPKDRFVVSHQYRNWGVFTQHEDVEPMLTYKYKSYCRRAPGLLEIIFGDCDDTARRITITEGMEWTPGGYLFLRRVHGHDDKMKIIPQRHTQIYKATRRDNQWDITWSEGRQLVAGDKDRRPYFVYPDRKDTTIYLEALGISHTPNQISIGSWSNSNTLGPTTQVELTIDYIRVFQPRNRYADMEPRYQ